MKGGTKYFHTLSFWFTFEYDYDTVSFAYAEPYTYSDLQKDLNEIRILPNVNFKRDVLCKTLSGRNCDVLTITSNELARKKNKEEKMGVIITGRVHPGETVGSWMMKGLINFLVSKDQEARTLREKYIFKIVPMLNPDGVIQGNYRTSLSGWDLNRRYSQPSKVSSIH